MKKLFFLFFLALLMGRSDAQQDKPVLVPEAGVLPVINGEGDDECWQHLSWQPVNQVWIPYGTKIPEEDFSGRFKIVWSSESNLLYFLFEVNDNVLVDGFIPGVTADLYNYDLAEVFIDEDKSGGKHVFDGTGNTAQQWGSNAENAFAYHMYTKLPQEGQVTSELYAGDFGGTGWESAIPKNYASHFPGFAMKRTGNKVTREFSLIVYNDAYDDADREASRVKLKADKEIGLSLAYCDNDDKDEEPKVRDHFFGSVYVTEKAYNNHWISADDFGTIKLVENK